MSKVLALLAAKHQEDQVDTRTGILLLVGGFTAQLILTHPALATAVVTGAAIMLATDVLLKRGDSASHN